LARSLLSIGKYLFLFIIWWLLWAILQTLLLMRFGMSFEIAVTDSLVTHILLAIGCGFISNNLQFYLPKKERYWDIFFLTLGLSILILLADKGIMHLILGDTSGAYYSLFFSRSWPIRFDSIFLKVGCMSILSVLWYVSQEERQNLQRKVDTERLSREAELFKLRQQLAPHFLFNSLNSISALIASHPEQARKMTQQLSDFLRGNLRKEDLQWVLLSEELQYLALYLEIEKVRFGHRLEAIVDHDEASLAMKLPPMLLQPIVENAIKFGLYDTTEKVTITIKARAEDNAVRIEVRNPFDPETSRPKQGTGFGLSSIQRRLYLLFARADLLETVIDKDQFTTIVKIPQ
jgi:two-component system, LytTR family, sensor kinase